MSMLSLFFWHVGEDLVITFTATTPTPIAGWTLQLWIYNSRTDPQAGNPALFTTANAAIMDPVKGIFTFTLAAANTSAIGVGNRWLQVRRIDSGENTVLAEGKVNSEP
jgi:hypothetical protein